MTADEKISYGTNIFGSTVYVGRRCAAHLDFTKSKLPAGKTLRIIQGAFNTSVSASAGTHDKDSVLDVEIAAMEWVDAQRFLRVWGWAAWHRYPPSFSNHVHMVSLGCNQANTGIYVPGQIDDYWSHRSGLAGHVADNTWHPSPQFVFDYTAGTQSAAAQPTKQPVGSLYDEGNVYVEKLHYGQQDSDSVRRLQYRLMHHEKVPAKDVTITGNYGDGTRSAVMFWQRNVRNAGPDNRDGRDLTNGQANVLFGPNYEVISK